MDMVRIVAVGDNVVDCYMAQGRMFPGGNCLNVSVFARRFGAATSYIGAIGRDAAGDAIRGALAAEGVMVDRLRVLDGPTAYCVIGHRKGDRVFLKFDLGVSMFEPEEADFASIGSFDAVHVGQSSGLDAHLQRIASDVRLSYDFSLRHDESHRQSIAPLTFMASLSAGDLERDDAVALVRQTLSDGAEWCLATRGENGAVLGRGREIFEVAAASVQVVDTLGAGDTFIARTLVGLLREEEPRLLLEAAALAAAETCTRLGAIGHGAPMAVDAGSVPAIEDAPQ
jgi:fructoselysine 6-kinase